MPRARLRLKQERKLSRRRESERGGAIEQIRGLFVEETILRWSDKIEYRFILSEDHDWNCEATNEIGATVTYPFLSPVNTSDVKSQLSLSIMSVSY